MDYRSVSDYLKEKYGTKVYKISLQSGCTCPNRDGTLGYGGCAFCSEGGAGEFAAPLLPIEAQIARAKQLIDSKLPKGVEHKYIAYFQSYTNTYGDADRLEELYRKAIAPEEIVGLSVGTRPDSLPPEMIGMLQRLNSIKPVWVELGLQTIHEETARQMHRGYPLATFAEAYHKLKEADLTVIVHVILGLPGETREDMLETVRYLSEFRPPLDGIKLQLLHVLKGTELGRIYEEKPFPVMTLEEYSKMIVECLKILPKETIVHRITGDAPKRLLIAPLWSADKKRVLNTLRRKIREA